MRLTPGENGRLEIFLAAQFAKEALRRGLPLSLPEAIAIIADTVHWAARTGATHAEATRAGRSALRPGQVLDGVPALLDEIRVEPLFEEGTRLVVIRWPLGRPENGPGQVTSNQRPVAARAGPRRQLDVRNDSPRVVRVSSHHPFHLVNRKLSFDRAAADGWRLDLPAGDLLRWGPGQVRSVVLVPLRQEAS